QGLDSYTFDNARIPASGKNFVVKAEFTNGVGCIYETEMDGLLIRADKICRDQCNILNAQVSNLACASEEGYMTFELVVNGLNGAGTYQVSNVAGNSIGQYGQPAYFRTNSGLSGQTFALEISDSSDPTCTYALTLDNLCGTDTKITDALNPIINRRPSKTLSIYPNPATSTLFIDYSTAGDNTVVEIFDVLGKSVLYQKGLEDALDISQLDRGLHHLVIRDGANFQVKKFVKK
ncbi:MAG: T9SS type A sorting domain-containing protein, partial [Bacteroidota bacterium]